MALTRQNGLVKMWLNGVQDTNTVTIAGPLVPAGTTPRIGALVDPLYFTGYISNVRVVNGSAVYTTNFTPSTTPLTTTQLANANGSPSAAISSTSVPLTNYSNYFSGSNNLSTATNAVTAFGSGNFTIEFWMLSSQTTNTRMFGNVPGGTFTTNQWVITFNYSAAGAVSLVVYNSSSSVSVVASNATPLLYNAAWHHVAFVRSGSTFTVYVDGASSGTGTYAGAMDAGTSAPVYIGTTGVTGDSFYSGYLSNVRIVKGVAVYTGAFTPSTSPLTATQSSGTNISAITAGQTSILTSQSSTVIDNSGNSITVTNTGTVVVVPAYNLFGLQLTTLLALQNLSLIHI